MANTTMAMEGTGNPQAMPEPEVIWCGGENARQDVLIRLVRKSNGDRTTLAIFMAHSIRLVEGSRYFASVLSQSRESEPTRDLEEVTLHIDDDLGLYKDCFLRMYTSSYGDFKSVTYSLELLQVAKQLGCDDVMRSICLSLSSRPWSKEDEEWIRIAVSIEDFSRDHAKDLFKRLEGHLTKDDLGPFIARCMELGKKSSRSRSSSFLSIESATQAKEILIRVLMTARGQERSSTPKPEQEAVCVINEGFKLLLVAANIEIEAVDTMDLENNPGLLNTLDTIKQVLEVFIETGMADEAVECFAQYTSFPNLIGAAMTSNLNDAGDVLLALNAFIGTVVTMVSDLVKSGLLMKRQVHVDDLVRDTVLLNWLPLLNWLHGNAHEALGGMSLEFREVYGRMKQDLRFVCSSSQAVNEIIDKVFVPGNVL